MLHSKKMTLAAFCAAFLATSAVLAMDGGEENKNSHPGRHLTQEELSRIADEALDSLEEEWNQNPAAKRQSQQDITEPTDNLAKMVLDRFTSRVGKSLRHREQELKNEVVYGKQLKDRQRRAKYGVTCFSDTAEAGILEEKGYKWSLDPKVGMNRLYKKDRHGNYYSVFNREPMNVPINN